MSRLYWLQNAVSGIKDIADHGGIYYGIKYTECSVIKLFENIIIAYMS